MPGRNAWRGERELTLPGSKPVRLAASLDHIARLMDATGTETLDALQDKLAARKPAHLEAALAVLKGEAEAKRILGRANGASGLTAVYVAIAGAISGLTPEEEDEAKKAEAGRAEETQEAMLALLIGAIGRASQSSASPSESG